MTHHAPQPVERVCICPPGQHEHTPACNEQHRQAFFAAWRGLRAQLGWPDDESEVA